MRRAFLLLLLAPFLAGCCGGALEYVNDNGPNGRESFRLGGSDAAAASRCIPAPTPPVAPTR